MPLKKIAFALLPVLVLSAGLEIGARLLTEEATYAASGPMGWTMQPGLVNHPVPLQDFSKKTFTISTNADGLRTDLPRERTPGIKRLVVFGDSTIFGWGLSLDESPSGVLEAALGEGWEVLNAGQPGFSSEQASRLAAGVLPAYQPDGVIWFQPWHDRATVDAPDREQLPEVSVARPWWEASRFLSAVWSKQLQTPAPEGDPLFPFVPLNQPTDIPRVAPEHRAENITAVHAAAGDAWMVLSVLPNPETLDYARAPKEYQRELARIAERIGVSFVDPDDAVRGQARSDLTLQGDPGHYTAHANQMLMAPILSAIPVERGE